MSDTLDRLLRQGLHAIASAASGALPEAPTFRGALLDQLSPALSTLFSKLVPDDNEAVVSFLAGTWRRAAVDVSRPDAEEEPAGDSSGTVIDPDSASAFRAMLDTLFAEGRSADDSALLLLQSLLPAPDQMAASVPTVVAAPLLPKGSIERIAKAIEKRLGDLRTRLPLLRKLTRNIPTKTFDTYTRIMERELLVYAKRAVVASVVQFAGVVIKPMGNALQPAGGKSWRDVRSDPDIGAQVHEQLQASYREQWLNPRALASSPMAALRIGAAGLTDFVLQEGIVHRLVTGPGRALKEDLVSSRDASIFAFWAARAPFQAIPAAKRLSDQTLGIYREDCVHMQAAAVWEIKPIRSAAYAVFQEFHYRWAFNLANALVQDLLVALPGLGAVAGKKVPRALRRIGYISLPDGLSSGGGAEWAHCKSTLTNLTSSYKKRPPRSGSYVAIVLTVPQLPGVVIYVPFDLPKEYLLVLVPLVVALVARVAKEAADLVDAVEAFVANAVRALVMTMVTVGVVLLMATVFAGLAGSAPVWLPALGATAGVAAMLLVVSRLAPEADQADVQQRIEGWQAVLRQEIPPGDVRLLPTEAGMVIDIGPGIPEPDQGMPERVDFSFGPHLQVRGLPLGLMPVMGEIFNAGALFGMGALVQVLSSGGGDGPATPAPVA